MTKTTKNLSSISLKRTSVVLGLSFALFAPASVYASQTGITGVQSVQQANVIKGHVVDETGEGMIGVTVQPKNGKGGTITDIDGNFSLNVPSGTVLTLSYTGYKSVTVTAKAGSPIEVKMEPDAVGLDEVVVIGFGTVKKRDLTGSVASVKAEAITQAPTSDVATSLQGRVTGLDVNDGELRIRGNRSINGSNDPLVIIDGVQGGSMGDINPQDIESIDVLKDASSTAIYGSQGANGVIIITTKKAEKGHMKISYDGSVTAAMRADHPDYRSGANYYKALTDAGFASGDWKSEADDLKLFTPEALAAYKAGQWTNYEKELQRSATWSTKHTLTISGGTERTSARFSLGYANNGNKWKGGSGHDRYTLRANIDHSIYKWVSAGVNFQLTHNRFTASPYEKAATTGMELGSPYGKYDDTTDTYILLDELQKRPLEESGYANPLIDATGEGYYAKETYSTNVVANAYLDLHPIDGLTFRTQFNTHLTNSTSGDYLDQNASANLESAKPGATKAYMYKGTGTYMEWNNILTYNFKMLPEDHHLGVTLLTSWQKSMKDDLSATSYGQTIPSNLWWNIGNNNGTATHSSSYTQYQSFSYAGRISYDYKSKYLFTASLRRDGASRLAEGHKWEWFPSAAIAWRVTDEPWMKNTKSWLDDLKLRATYGVTGNSGIGVYGTTSGVSFANWSFGFHEDAANRYILGKEDSGYWIVGNKDTKWEMSTTFDLGFDATFLNSRINVAFDWYNTRTNDLILLRSLPTSSGQDGKYATYTNIGSTNNRGVEFTINSRNIVKKNFQWNSTLSFSANREKIVDLVDGKDVQVGTDKERGTLMIGHPIKSYKSFEYIGIWKSSEADEAAIFGQVPGDIHVGIPGMKSLGNGQYTKGEKTADGQDIIYDKDHPYTIDENDIDYVGSTSPKWFAGFNNDFRIGNFDVNIYFYARWGQWADNHMATYQPGTGGKYTNMDYWVKDTNEGALLPAASTAKQLFNYKGYQSLWFADNSFIKLKRISLGYTLPKQILKSLGVSLVRVYATVNDPLYWVKSDFQKGYDPEGSQRSFTLGLNVNF